MSWTESFRLLGHGSHGSDSFGSCGSCSQSSFQVLWALDVLIHTCNVKSQWDLDFIIDCNISPTAMSMQLILSELGSKWPLPSQLTKVTGTEVYPQPWRCFKLSKGQIEAIAQGSEEFCLDHWLRSQTRLNEKYINSLYNYWIIGLPRKRHLVSIWYPSRSWWNLVECRCTFSSSFLKTRNL